MPELPEVESTVRYIREHIVGLKIISATIHWHRSVAKITGEEFMARVAGAKVTQVSRRGKFIVIALRKDKKESFLLMHLRMSGQIDIVRVGLAVEKHDRVTFELSSKKSMRFNDVRKFGKIYLVDDAEHVTAELGMEPLEDTFTSAWLHENLQRSVRPIKTHLLDQSFIAGIGNIYADEALFRAKIHPRTPSKKITLSRAKLLQAAIQSVLQEAIRLAGTDFGTVSYTEGCLSPWYMDAEAFPALPVQRQLSESYWANEVRIFARGAKRYRDNRSVASLNIYGVGTTVAGESIPISAGATISCGVANVMLCKLRS